MKEAVYAPITRTLYRAAFISLWRWAGRPPPSEISSARLYDQLLSEYIEHAWKAGQTRGDAGNALSASIHAYPSLRGRGNLSESWLLLNAWAKMETPFRAPPLPGIVALGLIWFCVRKRRFDVAFLIAAGFDAFLRTGEMLQLKNKDVLIDVDNSGTIKLAHTKSGQRHAAFESSTILDGMVSDLFRAHQQKSPHGGDPNEYIFGGTRGAFYDLFEEGMCWLGVASLGFKPYSIRRGGATSFYRKYRSMDLTLERGRWSTTRVGRIYINDGLAKETEIKLSEAVRYSLAVKCEALRRWLSQERKLGQLQR